MTHTVTLEPSGRRFEVEPDERILDAALREGVALPYGCRGGTCRSCRAEIIDGTVDYPNGYPSILTGSSENNGPQWSLLCQATPASDLTVRIEELALGSEVTVRNLPCRVVAMELAAADVMIVTLRLPEGEVLRYLPGQYIDILMRDGRRRSFSIANAPNSANTLTLHIRHVPGGEFSGHVFTHLREKALLRIRGPLGSFYRREDDRPLLFVAGGTGFAPIKAIIESCFENNVTSPMHLYWGVRSVDDLYLDGLVHRWCAKFPQLNYIPVLSEPKPDQPWAGRTGFVHEAVLADFESLEPFSVYSSGPPVMVDALWRTFEERGLDASHHFSDVFEFAYETGADTRV